MATETKKPETTASTTVAAPTVSAAAVPAAAPVIVPEAETKPVSTEKDVSATETVEPVADTKDTDTGVEDAKKITQQVSFKEETNVVGDLPESQRKALDDLKALILEACAKRQFSAPPPPSPPAKKQEEEKKVEEVAEKTEEEKLAPTPPPVVAAATETATKAAVVEEVSTPTPAPAVATASAEATAKKEEDATPKTTQVSQKTEEVKKEQTQVPQKTEEVRKEQTQVPQKTEEVKKEQTQVPQKTEEVKKEQVPEITVEAIKETIFEVATSAVAAATKAAATLTAAVTKTSDPPAEETVAEPEEPIEPVEPEQVSIYGIPLLADERSDIILLKFLRARDFKVKDAFTMIRNTVRWRKAFNVDNLLDEDLGNQHDSVLFTHGHDKESRPVCYNVFGEFENKELYSNTFADAEKREKFFKWLVQFIEKLVRGLDFSPKGVNSIVLVSDLKNFTAFAKRDISKVINKFLVVLQDNYPEFVAKQLCINTSWWYVAYYWIYLTVFTPRSKSKFVFASPSKTPNTLFKYIAPEQVPVQYGGHSKNGVENVFSSADTITEVTIKPNSVHPIEFTVTEATELVWELRVIGWDVTYGAEFVPEKEGAYTLNISKPKKVSASDEPVISDTFKATEAGKVVITVDNQSSKKKKLLYRSKVKGSVV